VAMKGGENGGAKKRGNLLDIKGLLIGKKGFVKTRAATLKRMLRIGSS